MSIFEEYGVVSLWWEAYQHKKVESQIQELLDEFIFADDMTKGATTEEMMQKGVDQVSDSWKVWIKYLIHVTAMISQSASERLRWYIS